MWAHDAKGADHTVFGVESVSAVLARATETVLALDELHTDSTIVLVAHGDTLQIVQTASESAHADPHHAEYWWGAPQP